MKTNKLLIGSGILLALVAGAYFLLKKPAPAPAPGGSAPGGSGTSGYPPGTLLRAGNDDKVFVIDDSGYRHWISNRGYFDKKGYKMSDVKSISQTELQKIPEASPLAGILSIWK